MIDVASLDALAVWMRANGATEAVLDNGRIELKLGPAPVAPPTITESTPEDAELSARKQLQRKQEDDDVWLFAASEGIPHGYEAE
jgi:hypothetical protein